MGADYYAKLYLGVNFTDVYETKTEKEQYELHDPKTGKKTGKFAEDSKSVYVNKFTKEQYPHNVSSLPLNSLIHDLDQEGSHTIIGVLIGEADQYDQISSISSTNLDKKKSELAEIMKKHGITLEPKLTLNLYCSY